MPNCNEARAKSDLKNHHVDKGYFCHVNVLPPRRILSVMPKLRMHYSYKGSLQPNIRLSVRSDVTGEVIYFCKKLVVSLLLCLQTRHPSRKWLGIDYDVCRHIN